MYWDGDTNRENTWRNQEFVLVVFPQIHTFVIAVGVSPVQFENMSLELSGEFEARERKVMNIEAHIYHVHDA